MPDHSPPRWTSTWKNMYMYIVWTSTCCKWGTVKVITHFKLHTMYMYVEKQLRTPFYDRWHWNFYITTAGYMCTCSQIKGPCPKHAHYPCKNFLVCTLSENKPCKETRGTILHSCETKPVSCILASASPLLPWTICFLLAYTFVLVLAITWANANRVLSYVLRHTPRYTGVWRQSLGIS